MRIIAIDPGYDRVGLAILEKQSGVPSLIFSTCILTNKKEEAHKRIFQVGQEISSLIEKYSPQALAIESLFFSSNQKTAMHVSEARGAIMYQSSLHDLSIFEYTPLQVKIAVTGHGRSDKKQIMEMVKRLISLPSEISSDDEFDAIAVGLTCLASLPLKKSKIVS